MVVARPQDVDASQRIGSEGTQPPGLTLRHLPPLRFEFGHQEPARSLVNGYDVGEPGVLPLAAEDVMDEPAVRLQVALHHRNPVGVLVRVEDFQDWVGDVGVGIHRIGLWRDPHDGAVQTISRTNSISREKVREVGTQRPVCQAEMVAQPTPIRPDSWRWVSPVAVREPT